MNLFSLEHGYNAKPIQQDLAREIVSRSTRARWAERFTKYIQVAQEFAEAGMAAA